MPALGKRRSIGPGVPLAALLGLAAPGRADAGDDPAGWARLESSRWAGLSIAYPPSLFDVVRPPADHPATIVADVDRLVGGSGDLEVVIGADDVAVGSASEYVGLELASDRDVHPATEVTYRARGKGWEVASGLIGGRRVFYYKAVERCAPGGCDIPTVSMVKFTYPVGRKGAYDKLLERMVRTFSPATGRLGEARPPPKRIGGESRPRSQRPDRDRPALQGFELHGQLGAVGGNGGDGKVWHLGSVRSKIRTSDQVAKWECRGFGKCRLGRACCSG